ncbi:DUF3857 domain-containing protein [Flavobacterium sp. LM4]|uniref:DUF3857 domain-containing protein n=1 Tax=Flavobacterium sp. LM4 TaxID=1938609 RepID=UPI0009919461|nr:DUF3857 domain-containing protein [Flavobacterium sp. LM4]OOV17165.1 hypothetical protein BXU10_19690 [Flavobacterium sp. LM4]
MRLRTIVISIVFIFVFIKTKAQNYELGKVTIAELEEKVHPQDSSAVAAILFKKGRTFFTYNPKSGFSANNVYEFKIKIYKKEGLSWANQKVRFYVGYEDLDKDKVEFSNAVTYNLEEGSIVKTKLNNQGEFKKNVNKYWNERIITLPNVKVGSVIEYKYILKSENIVKLPDFDIQYRIPVNYFEYKTEIPEYYIYKPILIGNLPIESDFKLASGNQNYENEYNQSRTLTYTQINSYYSGRDIPALIDEPYINNVENYRGAITQELERVRMPEQPVKDYSVTWEGVATTIFKEQKFGKELTEFNFLTEDVKRLLTNVASQNEKVNTIFQFVQNKMNWNEENGYYTDAGVVKAYAAQTGNVAEINFILINMLKLCGIAANPVLVSTLENGVPVYPTRTGFNYVIAAAEIDGKQILLDASHKFTTPGVLPLNVLNWKGRLIKKDGTSEEIDLNPQNVSIESSNVLAKIDSSGKMKGTIRVKKTKYEAYNFRILNANKNVENYLETLEEKLGGLKISDYSAENKNAKFSDPVQETFNFVTDNQSEMIGGKIFINPLLFFTKSKNPFTQEKRRMAIYFGYPLQEKINLSLQIPDGYMVESMPKPLRISSEDKQIVFVLNISNEQNNIQITSSREINKSTFAADEYEVLKNLFQKAIISQNEKIVLKKI